LLALFDRFISGQISARRKLRKPMGKVRRSAPPIAKLAGELVGIAPNGEAALPADSSDFWLPAPKIRKLLGGISPVTFWRWRHKLGFPAGRCINGRWYFQLKVVSEWHVKQAEACAAARAPPATNPGVPQTKKEPAAKRQQQKSPTSGPDEAEHEHRQKAAKSRNA
jgi:hypothetical protein